MHITGIRPGEKLHEVLISEDEARTTVELDDMYRGDAFDVVAVSGQSRWAGIGKRLANRCRMASAMPAIPIRSG